MAQQKLKRECIQLCNRPYFDEIEMDDDPCRRVKTSMATVQAERAYESYIEDKKNDFKKRYIEQYRAGFDTEDFERSYQLNEYHYTLYYHDQSGNLVSTVPPSGVSPLSMAQVSQVQNVRENGGTGVYPAHTMPTTYQFNSLNQSTKQTTPDGGTSHFWYDNLGRIVVSQNAKQLAAPTHDPNVGPQFSYTQFDDQGRLVEVGQLQTTEFMDWTKAFHPDSLQAFVNNATTREEVTHTYYDNVEFNFTYKDFSQDNLRGRVVSMTIEDVWDNDDQTYESAVHYTYDIHGNVNALVREADALHSISQGYKIMEYDYELLSGNVNSVVYQRDELDQFIHRYSYDLDNRLVEVETSRDNILWATQAEYDYYLHGPLKRTELGDKDRKVQGIDYTYTLHGWLKGVNSNTLETNRDIGRDGHAGSVNEGVSKDVFGFSLGYYSNDYKEVGTIAQTDHFLLKTAGSDFDAGSADLFNGNIKHMITALDPFMGSPKVPQGMTYSYDQLNRIKEAKAWNSADNASNSWLAGTSGALSDYHSEYSYDANGNILSLKRNGSSTLGIAMDDMSYHYISGTNKLDHVTDVVGSMAYATDIDQQNSGNYDYDEIGNLIKDDAEEIEKIDWTAYGKIKAIYRTSGSTKPNLKFKYSPDGHRIEKRVENPGGAVETTFYTKDATGISMTTYSEASNTFSWQETGIYGSSRIGVYKPQEALVISGQVQSSSLAPGENEETIGLCQFEMSNHLGNVLAVVSDKRTLICLDGLATYEAEVLLAQDYFAFGLQMESRRFVSNGKDYRYGFNGQEVESSTSQSGDLTDFGERVYHSGLGRWFKIDKYYTFYPGWSPYNFCLNSPILNADVNGNWVKVKTTKYFHRKDKNGDIVKDDEGKPVLYVKTWKNIFRKTVLIEKEITVGDVKFWYSGDICDDKLTKENPLTEQEKELILSNFKKEMLTSYTNSGKKNEPNGDDENHDPGVAFKVSVKFEGSFKFVNSLEDVTPGDQLIAVGDLGNKYRKGATWHKGFFTIVMDHATSLKGTFSHEMGHAMMRTPFRVIADAMMPNFRKYWSGGDIDHRFSGVFENRKGPMKLNFEGFKRIRSNKGISKG